MLVVEELLDVSVSGVSDGGAVRTDHPSSTAATGLPLPAPLTCDTCHSTRVAGTRGSLRGAVTNLLRTGRRRT